VGWTIFPGSPAGEEAEAAAEVEVVLGLEFEFRLDADFGFCAQGGRSGRSWLNAIPAKSSAGAATSQAKCTRKGVIDIGN
jgi:hypothetical protein